MSQSVVSAVHQAESEAFGRIDRALTELRDGSIRWAALRPAERAGVIAEVHGAMAVVAESWARTACEIKGIPFGRALAGEEWISGPYAAISGAGTLAHALDSLAHDRSPLDGIRVSAAPGGRSSVRVLPHSSREAILMHGYEVEVWTTPGVDEAEVRSRAGGDAAARTTPGGVGLVLGAGNITSIAPLDVLYELVAHGRTVLLKLNPLLGGMMSVLNQALWPLVRDGYVRIVQGGAETGEYLTTHPAIDHVHITGSAVTHDAIVWGRGEEAERRRAAGSPRLTVPISSELGGVSPVIVVPGRWSRADLRYQAEHLATMRLHNAGHNCIAGQLVVVSADWPQRDEFLRELRAAFDRAPARPSWYPGSIERIDSAGERASAERFEVGDGRVLLRPDSQEDAAWLETTELFAAVLGVVQIGGTGRAFLRAAIEYANDRLVGTLGANIVVDPVTRRGIRDFDNLIAELRYGNIGVNVWTGLSFLTAGAPWGAYPGATIADVQSGIGVVHNAFLIQDVERSVARGPFRPFPRSVLRGEFALFPKPPWFVTARSAAATGRSLSGYAAAPSWGKLPRIFFDAFRA